MTKKQESKTVQIIPADNWWARFEKKDEGNGKTDIWYHKVVCFALQEWNDGSGYRDMTFCISPHDGFIEEIESYSQFEELVYSLEKPEDMIYDGEGNLMP